MNNLDNIFKLIEAGYNKDEINELLKEDEKGTSEIEENKEDTSTTSINQVPDISKLTEALDGLNAKIKELDTSIKKVNILSTSAEAPKKETAEDVLASILTPKQVNKGGN